MKGKQNFKLGNSLCCLIVHAIRFFTYGKIAGLGSEQTSDAKNFSVTYRTQFLSVIQEGMKMISVTNFF